MAERRTNTINNSTSKQQFAFSKDERFKDKKGYTDAFGYEIKGQFGHIKNSGNGHAFTSSQDRFGYENVRFQNR